MTQASPIVIDDINLRGTRQQTQKQEQQQQLRRRNRYNDEELDLSKPGVGFRRVWFAVHVLKYFTALQVWRLRAVNTHWQDAVMGGYSRLPFEMFLVSMPLSYPLQRSTSNHLLLMKLLRSKNDTTAFVRLLVTKHNFDINTPLSVTPEILYHRGAQRFTVGTAALPPMPLIGHAIARRNSRLLNSLVFEFRASLSIRFYMETPTIRFGDFVTDAISPTDPERRFVVTMNGTHRAPPLFHLAARREFSMLRMLMSAGGRDYVPGFADASHRFRSGPSALMLVIANYPPQPSDCDFVSEMLRTFPLRLSCSSYVVWLSLMTVITTELECEPEPTPTTATSAPPATTVTSIRWETAASLAAARCAIARLALLRKPTCPDRLRERQAALRILRLVVAAERRYWESYPQPRQPIDVAVTRVGNHAFEPVHVAVANLDLEALDIIIHDGGGASFFNFVGKANATQYVSCRRSHLDSSGSVIPMLAQLPPITPKHEYFDPDWCATEWHFEGPLEHLCWYYDRDARSVFKSGGGGYQEYVQATSKLVSAIAARLLDQGTKHVSFSLDPLDDDNYYERHFSSPVLHAALLGDAALVRRLLIAGADPDDSAWFIHDEAKSLFRIALEHALATDSLDMLRTVYVDFGARPTLAHPICEEEFECCGEDIFPRHCELLFQWREARDRQVEEIRNELETCVCSNENRNGNGDDPDSSCRGCLRCCRCPSCERRRADLECELSRDDHDLLEGFLLEHCECTDCTVLLGSQESDNHDTLASCVVRALLDVPTPWCMSHYYSMSATDWHCRCILSQLKPGHRVDGFEYKFEQVRKLLNRVCSPELARTAAPVAREQLLEWEKKRTVGLCVSSS